MVLPQKFSEYKLIEVQTCGNFQHMLNKLGPTLISNTLIKRWNCFFLFKIGSKEAIQWAPVIALKITN